MFGNLSNTKFNIVDIENVCTLIKDGTHQTPIYTDDIVNGYKFLSSKDVMTESIDWSDVNIYLKHYMRYCIVVFNQKEMIY